MRIKHFFYFCYAAKKIADFLRSVVGGQLSVVLSVVDPIGFSTQETTVSPIARASLYSSSVTSSMGLGYRASTA